MGCRLTAGQNRWYANDMDKKDVLTEFTESIEDFFLVADMQRVEIYNSYLYMGNHRVDNSEENYIPLGGTRPEQIKPNISNISLLPAIVRGVAGSDAMNERHIDIVPIDDEDYDVDADIIDDCVDFAQYASSASAAFDTAKRDAATCGLGATVTYLDTTTRKYIFGEPSCERIYPGYLYFDTSGHGKDLNKSARFCGYGDPMKHKDLDKYIIKKIGDKEFKAGTTAGMDYSNRFMGGRDQTQFDIDMLYHHFWWDDITVYDTSNPLTTDEDFKEAMQQNDIAIEFMTDWAKRTKVDTQAPYWILSKEEYDDLKKTVKAISKITEEEYEIKSSQREVRCYYRAELAKGYVLSWSKSYSQTCHPLNFITGYFDETMGIYYGFTRPLSYVQDALDRAMNNLLELSDDNVTGGKAWIKGAGDDLKLMKKAKANKDDVTPIPPDSEIIPKQTGNAAEVLLETVNLLITLMPRVIGVGPELLGIISTGKMTDSLFGKIIQQSFAVLKDFDNSSAGYATNQGYLFIDLMTAAAEIKDGQVLPILSPNHSKEQYFRMTQQNIAREYVIRVQERPVTDDEKMENVKMLTMLSEKVQQAELLVPAIIENMRMDYNMKQELIETLTPKPQQPSQEQVELSQANIRMINAQAAKLEADAMDKAATVDQQQELTQSEIDENKATAVERMAKADVSETNQVMQLITALQGASNDGNTREPSQ